MARFREIASCPRFFDNAEFIAKNRYPLFRIPLRPPPFKLRSSARQSQPRPPEPSFLKPLLVAALAERGRRGQRPRLQCKRGSGATLSKQAVLLENFVGVILVDEH